MRKITLSLLAVLCPLCAAGSSYELSDTSRVVDLDEVTIVAQPKEQVRLRLQPLSSTVFGSEQLGQLHVLDLSQLSQYVPAFTMPAYGSRLTSSVYVRGIGSRVNSPAVGIYVDNIPLMSKAAFNHHFYAVDRVDILRGPQGTLYGQNTEGGLVRIYSRNPMTYQGTDIRLGIGTGLWRNVEATHYNKVSDRFAFSIAGFYSGLKGFITNQNFSDKNDKSLEAGGKLRLLWQPSQQLKMDWTTDYQWVNQNGFGYGQFRPLDSYGWSSTEITGQFYPADETVQDPATTIMNRYRRHMLNTGLTVSYDTPNLLFTSTTSFQHLSDRMMMDQDYMTPDFLQLEQCQRQNALTQEFALRSHDRSRWQHVTGLFGSYQWLRTEAPVTFGDAITGDISYAITHAMKTAMQQGIYAGMLEQMLAQGMPQKAAEAAAEKASWDAVEKTGISMSAEMAVPETFQTPQMNLGVFHESSLLLTDRLKLTLGLRLNYDWQQIQYDALAYMNMTGGTAERQATYHLTSHVQDTRSRHDTQLLPKLALTYALGPQLGNVYALVSKGYRAGGYNIQMFSDILQTDLNVHRQDAMRGDYDVSHEAAAYDAIEETISYKPEESWNFELGTHLNLFDSRLHLDLALYYMKIRNQQLSIMAPGSNYGRIMTNAGRSHSCGLELTLRGRAVDNRLEWAVSYGFTSAKFDEYKYDYTYFVGDANTIIAPVAVVDYKDNCVPFIPRHTLSAMADYRFGRFTLGLNLSAQGKTWWDEANTFAQRFYALLGAHADYFIPLLSQEGCRKAGGAERARRPRPTGITLSLWGRNLTNTHYNTFAVSSSAAGPTAYFAQRANPIQVGLDVDIHL